MPVNHESNDQANGCAPLAEHAAAIRQLGRQTVENIIEIGRRLVDCRDNHLDHGQWLPWLKREFGWSRQTADNFIHVYEARTKLPKFGNLNLPISGLYLLAAPSTPKKARDEIVKRVESGKPVPVAEVKRVIGKAKGRQQPATKSGRTRGATHVCWQCSQRGKVGEVIQYPCDQYDDADVWLHEACISAFEQAEQLRAQQRDAALERINALRDGKTGSVGDGEIERLQAENVALRSEIEDLRAASKPEHLSVRQLVDLLERQLEHNGINATAQLRKIRDRIEQERPQIDLAAVPVSGSA